MGIMPIAERFLCSAKDVPPYTSTLTGEDGTSVEMLSFGCAITAIRVRDRRGAPVDVAPGFGESALYFALPR